MSWLVSLCLGVAVAMPLAEENALLQSLAPGPPAEVEPAVLEDVPSYVGDLPVRVDADVATWVALYRGPLKPHMDRWLERLDRDRASLARLLDEERLPRGLRIVAVVESGMLPEATSVTGCAGTWQLAVPTARALGLRVDADVDERRDPVRSARAAAALFRELYAHYEDWDLTLAAYNAGQGTVDAAVERAGSSRWTEVAPHLGAEARHFVAKVHAAAIVDHQRAGR